MPKINVNRSIYIASSPKKIFPFLNNLAHWETWSPWVIAEPDAAVKVSKDGKYHEWEGKIIGSGNLKITSEVVDKEVVMDLTFLTPWKSKAVIKFILEARGKGTVVTWEMQSKLPFFLFWMKGQMQTFIGMDYDRGLMMMKDLVETGKTNCALTFKGEVDFESTTYIGLRTQCGYSTISTNMERDFTTLMEYVMQLPEEMRKGPGLSIYEKFDVLKDQCHYVAAFPLHKVPEDLPSNFIVGELPSLTAYSIEHLGPYRHIGNAWAAGMMHQRSKKFNPSKKNFPMELMHNSPKNTPENELLSEILFPVK